MGPGNFYVLLDPEDSLCAAEINRSGAFQKDSHKQRLSHCGIENIKPQREGRFAYITCRFLHSKRLCSLTPSQLLQQCLFG